MLRAEELLLACRVRKVFFGTQSVETFFCWHAECGGAAGELWRPRGCYAGKQRGRGSINMG